MKLSELFHKCAYTISYQTVGDGVNYAFEEKGSNLYIYFQGSNQITDWVRNFLFGKKPYKDMTIPYKVHRGFLAAWKEVEDIIINKITEKEIITDITKPWKDVNQIKYKWKYITVVGYSHGGALAGFCHECVWFWRPDLREKGLEGYGFEAPRFYAGYHVKKELKERWATFKVIRNNSDIVTHCPPVIFGYSHVGEIFKVHGDRKLVENKVPCCIKDHYPQCVYDGLKKEEND
jgi:hypothetical protein